MKTNGLRNKKPNCITCEDTGFHVDRATGMLIYCHGLAGGYFPCRRCDKGREEMANHRQMLRKHWPWWKRVAHLIKDRWHRAAKWRK